MSTLSSETRMPWYGYVIANAIVWIIAAVVFVATKKGWWIISSVKDTIDRPAVGALLIFIPIAFLVASIYDFVFDRFGSRVEASLEEYDEEDELIPTQTSKSSQSKKL